MNLWRTTVATICLGFGLLAAAQQQTAPAPSGQPGPGAGGDVMYHRVHGPDGGMMVMHGPPPMKWWKDSETAQKINLSDAQAQQLEKIYTDHKMKMIDEMANLEKAELKLDSLINADNPIDNQVTNQVDQVVLARGQLEKEHALMTLDMRRQLSADQWKKLQSMPGAMGFGKHMFIRKFEKHVPPPDGGMEGPMPPPGPGMDD